MTFLRWLVIVAALFTAISVQFQPPNRFVYTTWPLLAALWVWIAWMQERRR